MATFIVLIPGLFAFPPPMARPSVSVEDIEPNDTLEWAIDTGLTDIGVAFVAEGLIGYGESIYIDPRDRDLYAVHVSEGASLPRLITVAMTAGNDGYDGWAGVFNATGRLIGQNDDGEYPDLNPVQFA